MVLPSLAENVTTASFLRSLPLDTKRSFSMYLKKRCSATGDFYGAGYTGNSGSDPAGTIFKVSATGKETVRYNFCPGGTSTAGICFPDASKNVSRMGNPKKSWAK
jgi:hypothetical protein